MKYPDLHRKFMYGTPNSFRGVGVMSISKIFFLLEINDMSITAQKVMSSTPMPHWVFGWKYTTKTFSYKCMKSRSVLKNHVGTPQVLGVGWGFRSIKKSVFC